MLHEQWQHYKECYILVEAENDKQIAFWEQKVREVEGDDALERWKQRELDQHSVYVPTPDERQYYDRTSGVRGERLFCGQRLHRLQAVLLCLSPEVH